MPDVTRADIAGALRCLGVRERDTIMVHSSLSSFGHVDGGAEAVVDALVAAVGEGGTVMVPTLTATLHPDDWESISGLAFHRDATPSRVGIISEALRRRPEARRSDHPTHSLAALGSEADYLVAGHGPTTFNPDGPYGKLCARDSMIIFLGIPPTSNTTLHAVEQWMGMPYLDTVRAIVSTPAGDTVVDVTQFPVGHRGFYRARARIHPTHEAAGIVRHARAGSAHLRAIRAHDLVRATANAESASPGVLLCEDPACTFCRQSRSDIMASRAAIAEKIDHLLNSSQAGA